MVLFNVCLVADDFSRVKLISLHNDEGSDYINANYIPVSISSVHSWVSAGKETGFQVCDSRHVFRVITLRTSSSPHRGRCPRPGTISGRWFCSRSLTSSSCWPSVTSAGGSVSMATGSGCLFWLPERCDERHHKRMLTGEYASCPGEVWPLLAVHWGARGVRRDHGRDAVRDGLTGVDHQKLQTGICENTQHMR